MYKSIYVGARLARDTINRGHSLPRTRSGGPLLRFIQLLIFQPVPKIYSCVFNILPDLLRQQVNGCEFLFRS